MKTWDEFSKEIEDRLVDAGDEKILTEEMMGQFLVDNGYSNVMIHSVNIEFLMQYNKYLQNELSKVRR